MISEDLIWAGIALLGAVVPLARYAAYRHIPCAFLLAGLVMLAGLAPMVLVLANKTQGWHLLSAALSVEGFQLATTIALWLASVWLLVPTAARATVNQRKNLFDLMPEGYAVLDANGVILDCNRAFTALSEVRHDHFVGTNIRLVLPAVADLMTSDNELFINALELDGRHYRVREVQLHPSLERGDSLLTLQDVSAEFVARQQASEREQNLKLLEAQLEAQSHQDNLTGLYNERYFVLKLSEELERAQRTPTQFGVLSIELDQFAQICERLGNKVGDEILKGVSRALEAEVRAVDTLARVGSEQFFVLALDTDTEGLQSAALRMQKSLASTTIPIDQDVELSVSASVGVAQANTDSTLQDLISRADLAMRATRGEGATQAELF